MREASERIVPVSLELGGKSPLIVSAPLASSEGCGALTDEGAVG